MAAIETLPDDFSDVTAESYEESVVDGNGQLQDSDSIGDAAIEESNGVLNETEISETEMSLDSLSLSSDDEVIPLSVNAFSLGSDFPSSGNLWQLSLSGSTYYVYFPIDAHLLVVDGHLVNIGSSSVTGLASVDGTFNIDTYNSYYLTLQPISTTSGNNNAYRYGSRSSLVYYYPGTSSSTLSSKTQYVTVEVLDQPKPGYQFSAESLVICGLLLFLCLVELVGGIIRR